MSKRTALENSKGDHRIGAKLRSNGCLQRCFCLLIFITFSHFTLLSSISISNQPYLLSAISVILVFRTFLNKFDISIVDLLIFVTEEGDRNFFNVKNNFNLESLVPFLLSEIKSFLFKLKSNTFVEASTMVLPKEHDSLASCSFHTSLCIFISKRTF